MLRRQLPVYSPVTWSAVAAGLRAAMRGDPDEWVRRRLVAILASRYGAKDVLLTDSGTSALLLAIAGASRNTSRPVALPGYGCYDLATAAEGAQARVALYDLDPETLGPDLDSLRSVASMELAAVVVAHLYGYPVDLAAVRACVGEALLIEDAAQGVGGRLDGTPLGALGSVSVLSFGRGKGMTGGGGGAVLAHDARGVEIVQLARDRIAGETPARGAKQVTLLTAQFVLGRPALYGLPAALPFLHLGETLYRAPWTPGPMGVAPLAVLERVMTEVDRETRVRAAFGGRLASLVEQSARMQPVVPVPGAEPGYLRLPVMARGGERRALLTRGMRRRGVLPGYPTALTELESLVRWRVGSNHLPGAAALAEVLITVPTHSRLSKADLAAIEGWIVR